MIKNSKNPPYSKVHTTQKSFLNYLSFAAFTTTFFEKSLMACIVYVLLFIMVPQEVETVALSGTGLAQWRKVGVNSSIVFVFL